MKEVDENVVDNEGQEAADKGIFDDYVDVNADKIYQSYYKKNLLDVDYTFDDNIEDGMTKSQKKDRKNMIHTYNEQTTDLNKLWHVLSIETYISLNESRKEIPKEQWDELKLTENDAHMAALDEQMSTQVIKDIIKNDGIDGIEKVYKYAGIIRARINAMRKKEWDEIRASIDEPDGNLRDKKADYIYQSGGFLTDLYIQNLSGFESTIERVLKELGFDISEELFSKAKIDENTTIEQYNRLLGRDSNNVIDRNGIKYDPKSTIYDMVKANLTRNNVEPSKQQIIKAMKSNFRDQMTLKWNGDGQREYYNNSTDAEKAGIDKGKQLFNMTEDSLLEGVGNEFINWIATEGAAKKQSMQTDKNIKYIRVINDQITSGKDNMLSSERAVSKVLAEEIRDIDYLKGAIRNLYATHKGESNGKERSANSKKYDAMLSVIVDYDAALRRGEGGKALVLKDKMVEKCLDYIDGRLDIRSTDFGKERFDIAMTVLMKNMDPNDFGELLRDINKSRKAKNADDTGYVNRQYYENKLRSNNEKAANLAHYTPDQLAERYKAREEMRLKSAGEFLLEGPGSDGGWNAASPFIRRNWNLTEDDMKDIEKSLADEKFIFETDIVKTEESTVAQCNDAMKRMKKGDYSKFNHLPVFLREYYGKKMLREVFGSDMDIPPLDDEMKKKMAGLNNNPVFRYAMTQLIDRNAVNSTGEPMANLIKEYDSYMNHVMLANTLNPVSDTGIKNIKKKYPGEKGDKIIEDNSEKQVFVAKTIFMAQLGRTDIISGENGNQVEPYYGNISELFAHGSRVIFTLPPGNENVQDKVFDSWRKKALDRDVMIDGRFASHDMRRRHVDDDGNMTQPAKEIRYKWKEQILSGQLNKKVTTYANNYGMNIPLGGLGKKFNGNDCVDGEGTFGHIYIKAMKGEKNRCGTLLIGVENSAPKTESCIGQLHNFKAIGHDMSTFFASKKTVGAPYGGREIDLSHMKADEFEKAMNQFEAGYRELQKSAKKDPEADKKLKSINNKLCGGKMTAIELAALMTSLGMEKKDAIKLAEAGRSVKDARYPEDQYREDMKKITDPEKVIDRPYDKKKTDRMKELKGMSSYVDSMRRQWNVMASHTLFDAWNTDEFSEMEKAMKSYLKAYDNIMAGKTANGKELLANPDQLPKEEYKKLKALEEEMVFAAKDYHNIKMQYKEGDFNKHSTAQARDRDAMSIMISEFSVEARKNIPGDLENPAEALNQAMNKSERNAIEKQKNQEARRKLDERVRKLSEEASQKQKKTANNPQR
ncbi:MAG: hypothetical protein J5517_02990 [Eubacterium sp.]|nr:hypothetical protein [Eubacterium sp.]